VHPSPKPEKGSSQKEEMISPREEPLFIASLLTEIITKAVTSEKQEESSCQINESKELFSIQEEEKSAEIHLPFFGE